MLLLLPFLNNGFITGYFRKSGKIPDDSNLLDVWFRGELIKGEHIFSTLVEISSYPNVFFDFGDLIIFSISLVDIELRFMFGKGLLKVCDK
jgi:hypothetical protein